MTFIGKWFVLVVLLFSLLFFSYAVAVYAQAINWGWDPKYANKEFGEVIPSELDRHKPVIDALGKERQRALTAWIAARDKMVQTEAGIAEEQVKYVLEMERIRSGKSITRGTLKKEKPWLFRVNPKTGKPFFTLGKDDEESLKSYEGYSTERNQLLETITGKRKKVEAAIVDQKRWSDLLAGKLGAGGKKEKGLYDLIALEMDVRRRAEEEREELKPLYIEELVQSQLLLKRQESLRQRVKELEDLDKEKR